MLKTFDLERTPGPPLGNWPHWCKLARDDSASYHGGALARFAGDTASHGEMRVYFFRTPAQIRLTGMHVLALTTQAVGNRDYGMLA